MYSKKLFISVLILPNKICHFEIDSYKISIKISFFQVNKVIFFKNSIKKYCEILTKILRREEL